MEEILKWGVYVITGFLAWWGNEMKRELNDTKNELQKFRLHVVETYPKKEDLREMVQPVLRKLDRIEEYLLRERKDE